MEKVIKFLDGKKVYIGIGTGVVYSVLVYFGVVESNELVWAAIAGWTGVAFRLAVK
jgi:hypothetical protein